MLYKAYRSAVQARNQLGTPGGSKCSLRGATFLKLCPTHFFRRDEASPRVFETALCSTGVGN